MYLLPIDASAVQAVYEAMEEYMNSTCISFRPRSLGDTDYVRFYKGVGYVTNSEAVKPLDTSVCKALSLQVYAVSALK